MSWDHWNPADTYGDMILIKSCPPGCYACGAKVVPQFQIQEEVPYEAGQISLCLPCLKRMISLLEE